MTGKLLTTREVADIFGVTSRTVTDWARRGYITYMHLPSGHYRYPVAAVKELAATGVRLRVVR